MIPFTSFTNNHKNANNNKDKDIEYQKISSCNIYCCTLPADRKSLSVVVVIRLEKESYVYSLSTSNCANVLGTW